MIRLMGLVTGIKGIGDKPVGSTVKEELTDKQKKLDVDKDGEIEGSDLAKLRAKKDEGTGEDHEVSMGQSTLDSIIKHATELKSKIGQSEKDIPAWIQDHIAVAENNLDQANTSYHEYGDEEKTDMPVDKEEIEEGKWDYPKYMTQTKTTSQTGSTNAADNRALRKAHRKDVKAKAHAALTGKSTPKVKNPKTGKEILATTAVKNPSHPAHNAAKSALGKK